MQCIPLLVQHQEESFLQHVLSRALYRWSFEDNSEMIFLISQRNIFCDNLKPLCQAGSGQIWKHPPIITVTPFLSRAWHSQIIQYLRHVKMYLNQTDVSIIFI